MEDLIPLLIFIIIAAANFMKNAADKSGKPSKDKSKEVPPDQEPSTLEDFFEEIERKFKPQPRAMPEWPEEIERPDYVGEMAEYEAEQAGTEAVVMLEKEAYTAPGFQEEPVYPVVPGVKLPQARSFGKAATIKIPAQGAVFSGLGHMRMSMPPLLRSATGTTRFELKKRAQLKQALIASMVFGQPRAYDHSFDTTLAK